MSSQTSGIQTVREQIDDQLISDAEENGINVDEIIEAKVNKHHGYQPKTIANLATGDIRNRIEAEQAEQIKGILMGSRDRYGKNWPRRHSLIRSNGEHLEAGTWGGTVPGPGGSEISIPIGGSAVQARVTYDTEYESYDLSAIDSAQEFTHAELVESLDKIAISPSHITQGDEYNIVVVKGVISWVDTQTIFEDGEPTDTEGPVIMQSGGGDDQMHLELVLQREEWTHVRAHFERMASGKRYIDYGEFDRVVHDAYQSHESPEDQVEFIRTAMRGNEVFVVGNINNVDQRRDDDNNIVNYVDMAVTALVSADPDEQLQLTDVESTDAESESADDEDSDKTEPEPVEADAEPDPDPGPDPETESEQESSPQDIEAVEAQIETYCDLTGTDPANVTVEDVQENLKGVDAPEVVIRQALKRLAGNVAVDEPDSEPEPEPIETDRHDDGDEGGDGSDSPDFDAPFNPSERTIRELRDEIKEIETAADVEALLNAENSNKARKTAIEIFEGRLNALSSGATDEPQTDPESESESEGCLAQASTTGEITAHIYDEHGAEGNPIDWISEQLGVDDAEFGDIQNDDGMYECPGPAV